MIVQVTDTRDSEYTNLLTGQRLTDTYTEIAKSNLVLMELKENLDLTYSTEELRSMIAISTIKDTLIIQISVSTKVQTEPSKIANELIVIVQDVSLEYDGLEAIGILDTAIIPSNPSGPNRSMYLVMSIILGGFAGTVSVLLLEFLDNSIKTSKDVEKVLGLRVLGTISEYNIDEEKIIHEHL